ncbi:sulfatase [Dysgonomonas sp. Marseille-P4677]|uniref:sulfatase family protein n=1 Tax=Dysgonomonas sp. Marseille-P4677 TaxID=2364790 RepID=UPI0019114D19|nr:sulfatase [Dysgonomonas sp. Marseille-P4677]MBK5719855.1 sulfatase [Dysgonomonas sp. Marseille-P4677]
MKKIGLFVFVFFYCYYIFATEKRNKPNVILIFMDDLGYGDLTSYGALGYKMPNLDILAKEGMRFTDLLAGQAVSSASRAALMTGCYPNRIGFYGALSPFTEYGLHSDEETIAELLKYENYATAIVGKWHLGHQEEFLPHNHGFDTFFGLPYSNDMWTVGYDGKPIKPAAGRKSVPPLPLLESKRGSHQIDTTMIVANLEDQAKLTTLYTEQAVKFIKSNTNNPFFLYFAHSMPHVPLGVSNKFKGQSEQGLYGDVMMEVDWSVGEIMKTLKAQNIDDNTLVIFLSDNGPWINFGNHAGNTGGLREAKGCNFEGGIRVPCIVRWPHKIEAGSISNKLSSSIDILPTICEIVGAPLPKQKIDGVDISSILFGKDETPRTEFYYYYKKNDLEAVRKGSWKLVFPHKHRSYEDVLPKNDGFRGAYKVGEVTELCLYDLRRDPGERYNVAAMYPEIIKELQEIAEKAREDLGDNLTKRQGKNRRAHGELTRE